MDIHFLVEIYSNVEYYSIPSFLTNNKEFVEKRIKLGIKNKIFNFFPFIICLIKIREDIELSKFFLLEAEKNEYYNTCIPYLIFPNFDKLYDFIKKLPYILCKSLNNSYMIEKYNIHENINFVPKSVLIKDKEFLKWLFKTNYYSEFDTNFEVTKEYYYDIIKYNKNKKYHHIYPRKMNTPIKDFDNICKTILSTKKSKYLNWIFALSPINKKFFLNHLRKNINFKSIEWPHNNDNDIEISKFLILKYKYMNKNFYNSKLLCKNPLNKYIDFISLIKDCNINYDFYKYRECYIIYSIKNFLGNIDNNDYYIRNILQNKFYFKFVTKYSNKNLRILKLLYNNFDENIEIIKKFDLKLYEMKVKRNFILPEDLGSYNLLIELMRHDSRYYYTIDAFLLYNKKFMEKSSYYESRIMMHNWDCKFLRVKYWNSNFVKIPDEKDFNHAFANYNKIDSFKKLLNFKTIIDNYNIRELINEELALELIKKYGYKDLIKLKSFNNNYDIISYVLRLDIDMIKYLNPIYINKYVKYNFDLEKMLSKINLKKIQN